MSCIEKILIVLPDPDNIYYSYKCLMSDKVKTKILNYRNKQDAIDKIKELNAKCQSI